jgi:hypothetical protein
MHLTSERSAVVAGAISIVSISFAFFLFIIAPLTRDPRGTVWIALVPLCLSGGTAIAAIRVGTKVGKRGAVFVGRVCVFLFFLWAALLALVLFS